MKSRAFFSQYLKDVLYDIVQIIDKKSWACVGISVLGVFYQLRSISQSHAKIGGVSRYMNKTLKQKGDKNLEIRNKRTEAKVDKIFFTRLLRVLKICFPKLNCKLSILFATQFFVLISKSVCNVVIAKSYGYHVIAVVSKKKYAWLILMLSSTILFVNLSIINAGIKFLNALIAIHLRVELTKYIHKKYISGDTFYRAKIDSPDSRLVHTVRDLSERLAELFSRTFQPILNFLIANVQLYQGGFTKSFVLYGYSISMGIIVSILAPRIGSMINKLKEFDGHFSNSHSRIRHYKEEIAMLNGAQTEREICDEHLDKITEFAETYRYKLFFHAFGVGFLLKHISNKIGAYVLNWPAIHLDGDRSKIAAKLRSGEILILQGGEALTDIFLIHNKLQQVSGSAARVMEVLEAVDSLKERKRVRWNLEKDGKKIEIKKLSIENPDKRLLLKDLSLSISPGDNICIVGDNGVGKTSLFRVLGGLWAPLDGEITRPDHDPSRFFSATQKCYLVSGTLRNQVTYPLRFKDTSRDSEVREVINAVGLQRFLSQGDGLDEHKENWQETLSGGEAQRIGFARIFFHKPKFALLDEVTSGVAEEAENKLYSELSKRNVTYISIVHKVALERFHMRKLKVLGNQGKWQITGTKEVDFEKRKTTI